MKKKKLTMAEVEGFFISHNMRFNISGDGYIDENYCVIPAEIVYKDKIIATITAISRIASDDIKEKRGNDNTAHEIATAKAKRGLYKLVHGKTLHGALYQGRKVVK
jgi:hypothetical protein